MSFARFSMAERKLPKGFKRRKQNDTQKKRRARCCHSTPPTTTHGRGPGGKPVPLFTREHAGSWRDAVSWSDLTEEAREALDTHDFGMVVPFNSYNFEDNLTGPILVFVIVDGRRRPLLGKEIAYGIVCRPAYSSGRAVRARLSTSSQ
ncbi:hypothetical protein GOL96_32220 [Sinorhizobium medicae]|nr:hypothetical protein [Sinorhizobium medicae]MDX1238303.1 hypothetical protein [Sinorhizobium medicae]